MKIQIKNRYTGELLFEGTHHSMRECVESAVKKRANLSEANLSVSIWTEKITTFLCTLT